MKSNRGVSRIMVIIAVIILIIVAVFMQKKSNKTEVKSTVMKVENKVIDRSATKTVRSVQTSVDSNNMDSEQNITYYHVEYKGDAINENKTTPAMKKQRKPIKKVK